MPGAQWLSTSLSRKVSFSLPLSHLTAPIDQSLGELHSQSWQLAFQSVVFCIAFKQNCSCERNVVPFLTSNGVCRSPQCPAPRADILARSWKLSGALGGITGHGNGFFFSDQRLRTWANSTLISLPSFPLAQCIPDCAMTGGFHSPVPQEGCSGVTTATQQPGAEHLSFHEPSTCTAEPLPQGFLLGAAELRFSSPGWF